MMILPSRPSFYRSKIFTTVRYTGEPPMQKPDVDNLLSICASNVARKRMTRIAALTALGLCLWGAWYIKRASTELVRNEALQELLSKPRTVPF